MASFSENIKNSRKVLRIAWKKNPINGDANFDIDEDAIS